MKLYDVPRGSKIRVVDRDMSVPPGAPAIKTDDVVYFDHLDGMYSFCQDENGRVVHLAGWTEVEIVNDEEVASDNS